MAGIPKLTRTHVLAALGQIDREGTPTGEWSRTFELVHDGRAYPPQSVVSVATALATEEELPATDVVDQASCHDALSQLGFRIVGRRSKAPPVVPSERGQQAPEPAAPETQPRPRSTRSKRSSDEPLAVFCADIGSVKSGRFGWAGTDATGATLGKGRDMEGLVDAVVQTLDAGRPCALGFEAPLFVPLRDDPPQLTAARRGEGNRPWSAGAGCGALATGLVQVSWLLRAIRGRVAEKVDAFTDWSSFAEEGRGLFVWEAFVTGAGKPKGARWPHVADAMAGAGAFVAALPDPTSSNVVDESRVFSLLGAAMLRTGWKDDPAVLSSVCLVLRPD